MSQIREKKLDWDESERKSQTGMSQIREEKQDHGKTGIKLRLSLGLLASTAHHSRLISVEIFVLGIIDCLISKDTFGHTCIHIWI
jgi:hypothetical protein